MPERGNGVMSRTTKVVLRVLQAVLCASIIALWIKAALTDVSDYGYGPTLAIALVLVVAAALLVCWIERLIRGSKGFKPVAPVKLPLRERVRTWEFWRNLVGYFIVFSFLGHWAEMLFCQLIVAGVFMGDYDPTNEMLWAEWLFPFSSEGIAVALIVLLLHPLKEWLMEKTGGRVWAALPLSFVANGIVCTGVDFMTGMVANQDYSLWDYRALPFNFMGQVVLQNSLVYTVVATLIVWVVYPLMDRAIAHMRPWLADASFWALVSAYGFLALLHFIG